MLKPSCLTTAGVRTARGRPATSTRSCTFQFLCHGGHGLHITGCCQRDSSRHIGRGVPSTGRSLGVRRVLYKKNSTPAARLNIDALISSSRARPHCLCGDGKTIRAPHVGGRTAAGNRGERRHSPTFNTFASMVVSAQSWACMAILSYERDDCSRPYSESAWTPSSRFSGLFSHARPDVRHETDADSGPHTRFLRH